MAVKPTATNQKIEREMRGDGRLGKTTDYLKNDPGSWYYQKFKDQGNTYIRDDMWSEAAKRGETAQLIAALQNASKYESIDAFNKWDSYVQHDYDGYMLSLAIPDLDNTTKKERKDESTGYVFGEYTDQEWALEILNRTFEGYDAEQIEEDKKNTNFFVKAGAYWQSFWNHIGGGTFNFLQDIYNVGEGVLNMMANWSNDENVGNRFLWAFSNDDGQFLNEIAEFYQKSAFEWERRYTSIVNAKEAYDQGYSWGRGDSFLEQIDNTAGVGVGYTTWGRWWSAGTESIGYMLPSMVIPAGIFGKGATAVKAAKGVKQGIFYTGIFSGNISDTVNRATMNGQSYKDLNAGVVVANAAIKAGAQLAVEYALGAVMGFSGLDKLMGVGVKNVSKAASKGVTAAGKTGIKAVGAVLARGAKDMLKEGLEETLQDMSDGLIDCAFGGQFREAGLETLSIQNLVDSFIVGALTAGVTGAITNASVVLPQNRAIGVDSKGEVFKMGVFQTLNYRQALETMAQWNDVLTNPKASQQAKADAAFKMSVAMDTVGSVMQAMGMERAIMANAVLTAQLNVEAKREEAVKQLSSVDYATKLYNDFLEANKNATAKYIQKRTEEKIKKATERMAKKLKEKGVTNIEEILTADTNTSDPEVAITPEAGSKLQAILKGLGAEAFVGVDGRIIEKSGEIVFVDNKLIQAGDVENIIRGVAYEQVQQAVVAQLNQSQRKMLVSQYEKITGTQGTLEQAVTALLFDKNFYTYTLLLSGERHYKQAAIEMLATIDQVIKGPLGQDLQNGKIAEAAYKGLMEKVQETMRTGLIVYATNYARIDLGTISNEVLSAELKEEIKNHPNVRFSEAVDEGLADRSNQRPTDARIEAYDAMISKFITQLTEDQINYFKEGARSTDYNRRVEAYVTLAYLAQFDKENNAGKLVYLPTEVTGDFEMMQVGMMEQFFGVDWMGLVDGSYDANKLTREAQDFIMSKGYDMADKQSRLAAIREVLYEKSGRSLTIGNDGTILKVLPKDQFLKAEYLTAKGDQKLKQDLLDGKVKTVGDIVQGSIPAELAKIKLVISDKLGTARGAYVDGGDITLSGKQATTTVMHELTHATQFLTNVGIEDIAGGNLGVFQVLPKAVITDIEKYISETFPQMYSLMTNKKISTPQMVYFMLSGEIQANSTLTTHMFEVGFRFKNNRQELVSPDGSKSWSLKPGTQEGIDRLMKKLKKKPEGETTTATNTDVKEDRPLSRDEVQQLANDEETKKFMKGSAFVRKDGSPMVFYRGTKTPDAQFHSEGIFLSTKPYVASMYANPDTGALRGYVVNIPRSEVAVVDAKGASYDMIMFRGREWSTDELVSYVRQVYPEMKGLLIKNVIEDYGENYSKPGTNLIVFDTDTLRRATTEDNNRFQQAWRNKFETLNPETTSNADTMGQPGTTTYEAEFRKFAEEYAKLDRSFADGFGDEDRRYISNKVARESNLKYFMKKGRPIQLDPGVAAFVVGTTKDFAKLPAVLRKKIEGGTLTKYDIIDYVSTAAKINDYTFKAIAEHVFHNSELAAITYADMRTLMDHIEDLAALSSLVEDNLAHMTPQEAIAKLREIQAKVDTDPQLAKKYLKATKRAQTVKFFGENGAASFVEAHADTKQLNSAFFRHYNGTLRSLRDINNLGKFMTTMQMEQELKENQDTGVLEGGAKKAWNWIDQMKKAEIDYEADDVAGSLDSIPLDEKIQAIKDYITNELARRAESMSREELAQKGKAILARRAQEFKKLEGMSEQQINKRYLIAVGAEAQAPKDRKLGPVLDNKGQPVGPKTDKNRKDQVYNLSRRIRERIAGLKTRYKVLPAEVKQWIDPNNGYRIKPEYRKLSSAELDTLITKFQEGSKLLRERLSKSQRAEKLRRDNQRRLEQGQGRVDRKPNGQVETEAPKKKTVRQKVQVEYVTKVKTQDFEFVSPTPANSIVTKILDTAWNTQRMSTVKGVTNNTEQDVANAKTFFEENAQLLMEANLGDIEQAVRFFLDSKMRDITSAEFKKYQAVKMYFLGYVMGETGKGKLYADLNPNLKTKIEATLKAEATNAGTMLSVWQNIQKLLDPMDAMKQASMEIDGVELTIDEKTDLFEAAQSGDIARIEEIQNKIIERVSNEKTSKRSIGRKITTFRSMAMLSSPVTWLRNIVSNFALKRLNKLASAIGNKLWTGKTVEGQLKMTGQVTPEIQAFINKHFLDNKLFDTLVSNLSKYNPSDIQARFKDATGKAAKEAIFAQMVIKSMYNKYYNENLFNTKWINDLHNKLMKVMSDNSYVREAAIRYFGKMIAEKGYDLSADEVSDAVMNDFGSAIGLALADYMHSDNIFNFIETKIAETSELGLFAYKTLLPFASASWQWFKAALKLSPLGLGRAIFNMARLEKNIIKNETRWAQGKAQIDPHLTEYLARRDLGQGVIGTIGWCLGMMLAGFGWIGLEDDDYGTPKLRIGNLRIDISSIFGSSSLLAGAALITGMQDKGMTWDGFLEGLNRMADVTIDGFPLMQIVEMDMYSDGTFSMGLNQLESIALSFIPNIVAWFAGATYSGKLDKRNIWGRAAAKIPFLAAVVNEKKVDPYTGSEGSWWEAFNRFVPYLSVEVASENQSKSEALGLNKQQLKGQYEINGEEFNLSAKEVNEINKAYGEWNAQALELFYKNQKRVRIKVGNTYKTMSYNQMNDAERKAAVQQIMSKNATYAKILAWTKKGNKYYASADEYKELRRLGITSNLYRGTKGFVSK